VTSLFSPVRVPGSTSLADVTFCVIDIETTGGEGDDAITEIAAVTSRCGEVLATMRTFVECAGSIPLEIQRLTGISDSMVRGAPTVEEVLPSLLEIARGTVIVGHNVRFDLRFLDHELQRFGYPRLDAPVVDTLTLARRMLRDDSPDCRLGSLARALQLDHQPTHRALDDVLATLDLLHVVFERTAGWGITALDDLLALPRTSASPHARKLRWVARTPRTPGVLLAHGVGDEVIHLDATSNLRRRAHSWFASTDGRRIGPMLREAQRFSWVETPDRAAAATREAELLATHRPRYRRADLPRYRRGR
jgi:DNA polymerase-3 subunit epsilon